jgi:hypothetical protein
MTSFILPYYMGWGGRERKKEKRLERRAQWKNIYQIYGSGNYE